MWDEVGGRGGGRGSEGKKSYQGSRTLNALWDNLSMSSPTYSSPPPPCSRCSSSDLCSSSSSILWSVCALRVGKRSFSLLSPSSSSSSPPSSSSLLLSPLFGIECWKEARESGGGRAKNSSASLYFHLALPSTLSAFRTLSRAPSGVVWRRLSPSHALSSPGGLPSLCAALLSSQYMLCNWKGVGRAEARFLPIEREESAGEWRD